MVASALLCFSTANKVGHGFKYFIHPSQMPLDKVVAMYLQKPMISFIFLLSPVA
jgi:hypothetical protein